jgi:hypothetical protein
LTRIITLTGTPNSGKYKLATEIAIQLNQKYSVISEDKVLIRGETIQTKPKLVIQRDTFESKYRDILAHFLADIRNRSLAAQNNLDFIIYGYSVYDLLAFVMTDDTISDEQKLFLSQMLIWHGRFFASDIVVYCESNEDIKSLENGEKMKRLKMEQNLMQTLGHEDIDFWIAENDDDFRARNLISKLTHEFDLKLDYK